MDVTNWREDAQPERSDDRPEAGDISGARDFRTTDEEFGSESEKTQVLRAVATQSAERTEVLEQAAPTEVLAPTWFDKDQPPRIPHQPETEFGADEAYEGYGSDDPYGRGGTYGLDQTTGLDQAHGPDRTTGPDQAHGLDQARDSEPNRALGHHEPYDLNEMTIQLDGVGRRLDGSFSGRTDGGADHPAVQEDSDGPVFVDESGRRNRHFRRLGTFIALACAVYALVIVVTMVSGNSSAPWIPMPEQHKKPSDTSESTPADGPAGSASPGASLSPGAGTPSPGGTMTAPDSGTGSSGSSSASDTGSGPNSSATEGSGTIGGSGGTNPTTGTGTGGTNPTTGTGGTKPTNDPRPTEPTTDPDPTVPTTDPVPTAPTTGTQASGPKDQTPVSEVPSSSEISDNPTDPSTLGSASTENIL